MGKEYSSNKLIVRERLGLSLLVLFSHSFALTNQTEPLSKYGTSFGEIAVFGFFTLTGYLQFERALTQNPIQFIINRVTRIIPGLVACLVFCLLISTFSFLIQEQSLDWTHFASFFYTNLSIVNPNRDYVLTNVFPNNPISDVVNGSLWTITFEFWASVFMITAVRNLINVSRTKRNRNIVKGNFDITLILGVVLLCLIGVESDGSNTGSISYFFFDLIPCIIFGSFLKSIEMSFFVSSKIPKNRFFYTTELFGSGVFFVLTLLSGHFQSIGFLSVGAILFSISRISYGGSMKRRVADVSYGIYLYGFPVSQCFVALGLDNQILVFICTAVISTVMGIWSFTFIEKPFIHSVQYTGRS